MRFWKDATPAVEPGTCSVIPAFALILDMYTLGYISGRGSEAKAIADGPSILQYVRERRGENGIDNKIRFQSPRHARTWSSEEARWTVEV